MSFYSRASLTPFLFALLLGWTAANICIWLHTPLPWLIGPMFATAVARMADINLRCPVPVREAGQWAIGTSLGLYFTPVVLKVLASHVGAVAVGVIFALSLGVACGWLLQKLSGVSKTTAFFAMAIGGASEMADLGERNGGAVDRIAAAHSLRLMLVVAVIPFGFQLWGVHGLEQFVPGTRIVNYGGLALLILLTGVCALGLRQLKWPNVWVIGPMLIAAALTGLTISLSAMPEWMVHFGQLFIGISLGARFTPQFLHTAPRYLAAVALCGTVAILLAAGFGLGLAHLSGINPATAILATAPGGIAEMSLTAKTLQLGVPIVAAFHVTRMAIVVLMIGPLFNLTRHLQARSSSVAND
jgi:membrane AbrB-like protein